MLTEQDLKTIAPAVYRTKDQDPAAGASKHYKFITTLQIIEDMAKLGWNVYSASQRNSKKTPETTKHMVVFRSQKHLNVGGIGILYIPEILLINSHNRTSSFTFHIGIYRSVSNTRLIVNNDTFANLNLRHMGYSFESIQETINHVTENIPTLFDAINKFTGINLTQEKQSEFALKSFAIRYPEFINKITGQPDINQIMKSIDPETLLNPNREGDNHPDLWHVFNRIQENLIGGNFIRKSEETQTRQARPIVEIGSNIKVNKGLWSLAETFAK